jgi:hypothetical protein
MRKDSIFRKAYGRNEKRLYLGFDYTAKVLEKTISPQIFGVSAFLDGFLEKLNKMVVNNIDAVKKIKIFANPALDKNETKFN